MRTSVLALVSCVASLASLTSLGWGAPHTDAAFQNETTDAPLATLYLRTDVDALDAGGRAAINGAVRLAARLPGATIGFALEPRDQGAAVLAEALADEPDTSRRVALLARLADVAEPHWSLRRTLALVSRSPRAHHDSFVALTFLRRPTRLVSPAQSFLEVGGVVDPDEATLDALIAGEQLLGSATARTRRHVAGIAGHRLEVPWRAPHDACGPIELLHHLDVSGRVRLSIAAEVDPNATAGVQAIARALRRATYSAQVKLADLACHFGLSTIEEAAWVLGAAGIDPETPGLIVATKSPPTPVPNAPAPQHPRAEVMVDGTPTSFLDALSLQRLPSLRHRMDPLRR